VGWLPGLRRFVDEVEEPIRLALSLHAPEDALRSELIPVNDRYPLEDVLAECRRYVALRGRRVFIEYVMLAGVNDTVGQARSLARLLSPNDFKVNLIPYNPTGLFDGSSREVISAFRTTLVSHGVPATVRLTRGRDIEPPAASSPSPARRVSLGSGISKSEPAPRRSASCHASRSSRNNPAHTSALSLVSVESGWWHGVAPAARAAPNRLWLAYPASRAERFTWPASRAKSAAVRPSSAASAGSAPCESKSRASGWSPF
jgi:hypothetical protein